MLNFYNEKATIRNRRRLGFFSRKYGVNFVRACPVKECVGLTHFQTKEIIIIQVSKNIFNKNDNNVGLLRTVKKVWIQEEHSKQ